MNEINIINLSEQTKFRLSKIIGIEDYFHQEINQRKSCNNKFSKYVTTFDYIDKILIVSSATISGVCVISSASVVGAPVGIASASVTLVFFSNNWNNQKNYLSKKHDKILMLTKSNLDNTETLVSQALIDMKISHEEFNGIIIEETKITVKKYSDNKIHTICVCRRFTDEDYGIWAKND